MADRMCDDENVKKEKTEQREKEIEEKKKCTVK